MAGERYARLTAQVTLSHNDVIRGSETEHWTFTLGSQKIELYRGGNTDQFAVPDPDQVGETYGLQAVGNALRVLRSQVVRRSLPYSVGDARQVGTAKTFSSYGDDGPEAPVIEFTIMATEYGQDLNLDFDAHFTDSLFPNAWKITENVSNISPVAATAKVTDTGIFGTADGAIVVTASGGDSAGNYLFTWADGLSAANADGATRTGLKAGTYQVVVRDLTSVASVTLTLVVKSDPELLVVVSNTDTSITLTVSGGVAPYNYAWDDGSALASRTGLSAGTFVCVVSDSHGASRRIEVTLSAYHYNWSQNAIPLALDAGAAYRADPSTKPNLSFLCEVWVERDYLSGTFVQVGTTIEQPADAQGRTVFQVQALLAAFLQYHVPAPGATAVERADPLFRRYFLRHAQQYGALPTPQPSLSLERNYVLLGGLNFYEASQDTWFTDYQPRVQPFLTWEPTPKAVLDDQPEYLYYMVRKNPGAFRRQVRVHFADGSEQVQTLGGPDAVHDFEVWCLPVGYQALGLGALGKQVRWWEVFVTSVDKGTVLSETRRFVRERRQFAHRRYFLFATSLGGMATYAALGEAQLDVELTGTESARAPVPGYDPQLGDVAVATRALRPVVKVAAGIRTRAQLVASQDLLLSRRVLLLAGARWLPGFIKAKTSPLLDESKLVQTQEFEFTLPTERLYTPVL